MKSIEELATLVWNQGSPPVRGTPENVIDFATRFLAAYTKQQEPVAEVIKPDDWLPSFIRWIGTPSCPTGTKLYAAPVVPADMVLVPRELSDKTSDLLGDTYGHPPRGWKITYARILAMIAAGEKKS